MARTNRKPLLIIQGMNIIIILLVILRTYLIDRVFSEEIALLKLQDKIQRITAENTEIRKDILHYESFAYISQKAREQGLVLGKPFYVRSGE